MRSKTDKELARVVSQLEGAPRRKKALKLLQSLWPDNKDSFCIPSAYCPSVVSCIVVQKLIGLVEQVKHSKSSILKDILVSNGLLNKHIHSHKVLNLRSVVTVSAVKYARTEVKSKSKGKDRTASRSRKPDSEQEVDTDAEEEMDTDVEEEVDTDIEEEVDAEARGELPPSSPPELSIERPRRAPKTDYTHDLRTHLASDLYHRWLQD